MDGLRGLVEGEVMAAGTQGYTRERAGRFLAFQERINRELLMHRVIRDNRYTAWFRRGEQNEAQVKTFIVQFSVFSNQFLAAQLNKMINADTLEAMRASKEILANEIGVVFRKPGERREPDSRRAYDPDGAGTEGSIQGGVFHFEAAHFEWLCGIARALGLAFQDIGRRRHGTSPTLFFCDELIRLYGSDDYPVSQAASYAVENWAAAGFWRELIDGLSRYNERNGGHLPLGFFVWHDRVETQHALHTQEELEQYYFEFEVEEDAFIRYGSEMLDGVAAFWDGLDAERRALA
jgi:hypothetical protein